MSANRKYRLGCSQNQGMRRVGRLAAAALLCGGVLWSVRVDAQRGNNPNAPGGVLPNVLVVPGSNSQNSTQFPANADNNNAANPGGGANADFESLIDLIQSTVQPDSWAEIGAGTGDIREFAAAGVFVDAAGTLRLKQRPPADLVASDLAARRGTAPAAGSAAGNPRRASALRYVSLPRLEREIARRQAARQPLELSMLTLAGLERVRYVFVYPESGDVVLAGPAGDWHVDVNGRIVSLKTGQPVVRLDDLIVLLRRGMAESDSFFGCSIDPRQEALAKTQAFLDESSKRPLQPGQRKAWLEMLRKTVGTQDIDIYGIDPSSRVASVLVEADYHMKLIGMGLEKGVEGVPSYLDSIEIRRGQAPPPMAVLRWWFALHYDAVRTAPGGDAFELVGQGVRVLSESEMLAEQGKRVHTGQSDPLNKLFADRFTTHFAALAAKYPVYADLRNVFDLTMAVALIQSEGVAARAQWAPSLLVNANELRLPKRSVPRQVETVINHRVINRTQIVAGVSGGVMVEAKDVLNAKRTTDGGENLAGDRRPPAAALSPEAWWWDAAE
jgi:hypothetical protein